MRRAVWRVWGGLPVVALMSHQAMAIDLPDLPPIENSGALTYSFQEERRASGQASMQHTTTATVNPSTYIYEPWLATTNATLNFSKSATSGESEASSNNVTGAITLNVLPQSDYATEINYTRYDRTIQLSEDSSDLTGQSMRLTNRLILPDEWFAQSRLTHDEAVDDKGAGEASNEASLEIAKRWTDDLLRIGLEHRDAVYTGNDVGTNGETVSNSMTVRHRSQPFETLTTDGTSTVRVSSYTQDDYSQEGSVMQGVSTAVWKPAEFKDVTVHGALRTFQQNSTTIRKGETTEQETQTAFGTLSSSYVFQPRLVGNVGLNAGYNDNSTTSKGASDNDISVASFSAGGSAGLDYSSAGEDWQGFHWTWFAGNGMDVGTSGDLGMMWSDQSRVGHSLTRVFNTGWVDNLNFSVSQSSGLGFNNVYGAQIPLSHSATLSHTIREGKGWNVWSLSGTDTRTLGGETPTTYELVNLQVTQGYDPDRFSSISAALTFQASRQISRGSDTGFVDSISGNITYRERMVFGIENLNFSSDLAFNPPSVLQNNRQRDYWNSRSDYQPEGNVFGTQRWTNRLDHTIGQLRTSLVGRVINDEDGMSQLLMFQVSRRF